MTDAAHVAAVDVVVAALIRCPLGVVASYASDPSNAPEWYAKISEVEWQTTPPLEVGTRVAFVARFLGRELGYTYEIVEHTPESLVMRTAQGPFPMETSYHYASMPDGGTQMTLRNRGYPSGFARWAAPFVRHAMRRAMRGDLKALKVILERDQPHV